MTSIALSFVLISLLGATFAYRLQHNNWLRQQRIASRERLVLELTSIFADLDLLLSRRLFRSRRLLYALRRGNKTRIHKSFSEYDDAVYAWNERRNSFQIRLVRVLSQDLAYQFESELTTDFVHIGSQLERLVRISEVRNLNGRERDRLAELELELDLLARSVYEHLRSIYIHLQAAQGQTFAYEQPFPEREQDLDHASAWLLFRRLFVPSTMQAE